MYLTTYVTKIKKKINTGTYNKQKHKIHRRNLNIVISRAFRIVGNFQYFNWLKISKKYFENLSSNQFNLF